jgi:hypothetical protein
MKWVFLMIFILINSNLGIISIVDVHCYFKKGNECIYAMAVAAKMLIQPPYIPCHLKNIFQ